MNNQEVKDKIQEEIEKTEQNLVDYKAMAQPISPDDAIGRISRMDAINNKSITDNAIRNSTIKLSKLKIALEKVDHADFGLCYRCKESIPIKRILIKPESPFCVKCAR
jgi:DnaK suppressor protein